MSKFLKLAALAVVAVPVLAFGGHVSADSPGDLAGGADIYQVRNTNNSTWGSSASAACGETLKYSVKLSNTDFGQITNIRVKASYNGAMTATGTAADGNATSTTGSVSVSVPAGATLEADTAFGTQLVNTSGAFIANLSGDITGDGVVVDKLAGSTREFVQFQAKVKCQTPPKQIQVCKLDTKTIVTINESDFNSSKYSKDLNDCKTTPPPSKLQVCDLSSKKIVTIDESAYDSSKYSKNLNDCQTTVTPPAELPNTGAGNVVAVFLGAIVAGTIGYRLYLSRKLSRN